jgi:hypothetical protein
MIKLSKIFKKQKFIIPIGLFFIVIAAMFLYCSSQQLKINDDTDYFSTPSPSPAPFYYIEPDPTVNIIVTPAPTIEPLPTLEPTWIQVDVAPSSIAYGNPAYITVTSDSGDFWCNLYIDSVNPNHSWANMAVPVWVDSSTNTGTYEMQKTSDGYYFPPDAQYNIHAEWDDESSNQVSVWISST